MAQLASPDASLVVDLLSSDSIVSSGLDFEIVYQGPGLLNMNFKPNLEGIWRLNVTPNTVYSTEISGYCTFNFLAKFYRLDWNSTHPSLAQIQGQPIATSTPYIDIRMTAEKQSKLDTLDFLSFVTPLGQVIHQYPINEPVSDALVLSTEEFRLPNVSFYLRLEGKDNSKSFYQCIYAVEKSSF